MHLLAWLGKFQAQTRLMRHASPESSCGAARRVPALRLLSIHNQRQPRGEL
jgi:hypothetical protein